MTDFFPFALILTCQSDKFQSLYLRLKSIKKNVESKELSINAGSKTTCEYFSQTIDTK